MDLLEPNWRSLDKRKTFQLHGRSNLQQRWLSAIQELKSASCHVTLAHMVTETSHCCIHKSIRSEIFTTVTNLNITIISNMVPVITIIQSDGGVVAFVAVASTDVAKTD